ncbi:hypothetical protein SLI_7822 [Streptomyces lividans 1326]|uniref:Uncharacterized protein n=1 Tax=Streptomyces lividans 1326 TaxID=1200984 RepID=A0A7U9E3A3_STRLI|nr:hypothetical protein SLI_7822 [Streptomyces lividans 1326]
MRSSHLGEGGGAPREPPTNRFRSPVGKGEGQAAATGELVARAVAKMFLPMTFMPRR